MRAWNDNKTQLYLWIVSCNQKCIHWIFHFPETTFVFERCVLQASDCLFVVVVLLLHPSLNENTKKACSSCMDEISENGSWVWDATRKHKSPEKTFNGFNLSASYSIVMFHFMLISICLKLSYAFNSNQLNHTRKIILNFDWKLWMFTKAFYYVVLFMWSFIVCINFQPTPRLCVCVWVCLCMCVRFI